MGVGLVLALPALVDNLDRAISNYSLVDEIKKYEGERQDLVQQISSGLDGAREAIETLKDHLGREHTVWDTIDIQEDRFKIIDIDVSANGRIVAVGNGRAGATRLHWRTARIEPERRGLASPLRSAPANSVCTGNHEQLIG
tara:strand:- start:3548 stop:3970 length:423 start_codon:yes stop_codon:yes gene_type:complete